LPDASRWNDGKYKRVRNLGRYFRVQHAPEHFKELAEKVTSRVVANQFSFQYRADFLRATADTDLVPITVQLRNRDLSFQSKQGVQSAVLDLYGRITDPGGRVVQTFEDVISRDFPESLFQSSLDLYSIYQKSVPLRSGLYRLDIVIKDMQSGNIGVLGTALRVPHFDQEKLDASSLILADQIERVASRQIGTGQFVLDSYKVRPRLSQEFSGAINWALSPALQSETRRIIPQDEGFGRLSHRQRSGRSLAHRGDRGPSSPRRRATND